jgi:hypothetical protein
LSILEQPISPSPISWASEAVAFCVPLFVYLEVPIGIAQDWEDREHKAQQDKVPPIVIEK